MKSTAFLLLCFLSLSQSRAQSRPVTSTILSPSQVEALLPDPVKRELKLTYPILRVYKYVDKLGVNYCVLTESRDSITKSKDPVNSRIKAFSLKAESGKLTKAWEVNDFVSQEKEEQSIWFWTKYTAFDDYDQDAVTDPILVYGTSTLNSNEERIKVIIYYRGRKVAIRHQAGDLDFQRSIQVDKAFYALPPALQTAVRQKLALIEQHDLTILPHGWQQAMGKKATFINDSYYTTQ
jgi:hypothetical protein